MASPLLADAVAAHIDAATNVLAPVAAAQVGRAADVLASALSPTALLLAACAVALFPSGCFSAARSPGAWWSPRRVAAAERAVDDVRHGRGTSTTDTTGAATRARWGRSVLAPTAGAALATALLDFPPWFVILATGAVAAARYRALHRVAPPTTAETLTLAAVLDVLAACLDAGLSLSAALSAAVGTAAGPDGPAPPGRSTGLLRVSRLLPTAGPVSDSSGRPLPGMAAGPRRGRRPSAAGPAAGSHRVAAGLFPRNRTSRAQPAQSPALTALTETAALLALGGGEYAWQPVSRVSARPGLTPLGTLAAAAQRSASGGLRLADAARETAQDLRAACTATVSARAARAGVAMTAPLTLCFLPAFLCLGLAPVVWGLIQSLHF